VDIKKITKNDIVKAVRLQYITLLSDNQFLNLQKQFGLLNTELEILKSLLRNPSTNKPIICCFIDGKTARINPAQMKYQFE
jgi:hypothetical protein